MSPKSERTCAKCKNWTPGKTKDEFRALRLVNCRLLPRYQFMPAHSTCERFVRTSDNVIAARAAWLAKA